MGSLVRWFVCARSGLACARNIKGLNAACANRFAQQTRFFSRQVVLLTGRRYSEKHEWVEVEGDIATVGISEFAQDQLGDIVYAQLPEIDTEIDQDDECGALESVKAASELYSPISGIVTDSNSEVTEKPALINESPHDKGWLWKMSVGDSKEVDALMDEEAYQAFILDID